MTQLTTGISQLNSLHTLDHSLSNLYSGIGRPYLHDHQIGGDCDALAWTQSFEIESWI